MNPGMPRRLLPGLIVVVGLHSGLLGVLMLAAPETMLRLSGFPEPSSLFFAAQAGVFLLILGICYLLALRTPAFLVTILLSKACAVPFLLVQLVFFSAPPIVWAALVIDGAMLAATIVCWPPLPPAGVGRSDGPRHPFEGGHSPPPPAADGRPDPTA